MKTTTRAFLLGAALLAPLGACSKTDPIVAASATSAPTTAAPATTAPPATTSTTEKEEDEDTTTTKKSGGRTTKIESMKPSAEEVDCVDTTLGTAELEDPRYGVDENYTAGFQGGVIAACVDKEKVATALVEAYSDANPGTSDADLACLKDELVKFDREELGLVIAGLFLENAALLEAADEKINTACGL